MNVTNVLSFSDWNAVTFGPAKFQVDVKEGGRDGVWRKRPVDVKQGRSEYVDGP